MAVRDDFTAGEVLAAADLNDTFASKLDASAYQPGLVRVAGEVFNAVSAVSIDGCFTSTFNMYRVVIGATGSATQQMRLRLRASGSDVTSSAYVNRLFFISGNVSETTTSWQVGGVASASGMSSAFDLLNPQTTDQKGLLALFHTADDFGCYFTGRGNFGTACDGFTIFPVSGTMTGVVRVYGYRN